MFLQFRKEMVALMMILLNNKTAEQIERLTNQVLNLHT